MVFLKSIHILLVALFLVSIHNTHSLSMPTNSESSFKKMLENHRNPTWVFGIISDIQYAPVEDGASFSGTPRYYRNALSAAGKAARHFEKKKVDLVMNLGDIIDGKCNAVKSEEGIIKDMGMESILEVVDALSHYKHGPILHTYGNHELYNLERSQIGNILGIPFKEETKGNGDLVGYWSYLLESNDDDNEGDEKMKIRFVILDTYDIAMMGRCPDKSEKRAEAERLLSLHNSINYSAGNENSPEGLEGNFKRFVGFNGGVGQTQLKWLRNILTEAKENGEKVILLSHQPILPGSSSPVCLVWNYSDVLAILRDFGDTIIASFCGHAHRGGYKRDEESGIHFRVLEAVLESPDPIATYGMVEIYDGIGLKVCGEGDCKSSMYDFSHLRS